MRNINFGKPSLDDPDYFRRFDYEMSLPPEPSDVVIIPLDEDFPTYCSDSEADYSGGEAICTDSVADCDDSESDSDESEADYSDDEIDHDDSDTEYCDGEDEYDDSQFNPDDGKEIFPENFATASPMLSVTHPGSNSFECFKELPDIITIASPLPAETRPESNSDGLGEQPKDFINDTALTPAHSNLCPVASEEASETVVTNKSLLAAKPKLSPVDAALIQRICTGPQGQLFQNLYDGRWQFFFETHEDAALKLCKLLIPFCNGETARVDRLFRMSGLMRKEWDSQRGYSTYGEQILTNTLNCYLSVYKFDQYDIYNHTRPQISDALQIQLMTYSFDDIGNGERFSDKFASSLRYNYTSKSWMFFDGSRWIWDSTGKVKRLTDQLIDEVRNSFTAYRSTNDMLISDLERKTATRFYKHIDANRKTRSIDNMLRAAEHHMQVLTDDFDKNLDWLNLRNGILDLQTFELIPHNYEHKVSKLARVEYSYNAKCPNWMSFLKRILKDDHELIAYIQRAVGYTLSGNTEEHKSFMMYGDGKNGKSTFLNVLLELMGDYAINTQPDTLMSKQAHSGPTSDIARLHGKRFVVVQEPNKGRKFDEGLIKQLTGGDRITACRKYENEFEFKPEAKIWMSMNDKPIIHGTDDGIWRRLSMIPFTVQIPDEEIEKGLEKRLLKELPGILNWAIDGCREWRQNEDLLVPESVKVANMEYRAEMDTIQIFLDECTTKGSEVASRPLFDSYRSWAISNGENVLSRALFGREMGKRLKKRSSNGKVYYIGIELTPYTDQTDEVFGTFQGR